MTEINFGVPFFDSQVTKWRLWLELSLYLNLIRTSGILHQTPFHSSLRCASFDMKIFMLENFLENPGKQEINLQ
jgi:hypothetical protein